MLNLKKDIQTVKVTNDPNSYSTLVYGEVKIGKSTFVHNLYGKKALFLMTENRERGLVGADIAKINSWTDFLSALSQLNRDKDLKKQYDVVVIDTVDELKRFVENFAKSQFGETSLGENASWGADYKLATDQWENNLPKIHDAGYTPIFVGHDKKVTEKIPAEEMDTDNFEGTADLVRDGKDKYYQFEKSVPDLPKKYMNPINKSVDQILYLSRMYNKKGQEERVIHLRTSAQWLAGSTFKNMEPTVPLDAKAYKNALNKAVDKFDDSERTDDDYNTVRDKKSFDDLKVEANEAGKNLLKKDKSQLTTIIKNVFGEGKSLKETTAAQYEQVELFLMKVNEKLEDDK